jgi:arylsulfatase A-like enzyme
MYDLKQAGLLTAFTVAIAVAGSFAAQAAPYDKPNIIVVLADDYGADSASLYNTRTDADNPNTEVDEGLNAPTPALAALAAEGVKFANGWAMPVCTPTRGTRSLGKLPSTTGMGIPLTPGGTPRIGAEGPFAGVELPPSMIDPSDPNQLQRLAKNAGYYTIKIGKWHETQSGGPGGADAVQDVLDSGFDFYYGQNAGGPLTGYGGTGDAGFPAFGDNTVGFWIPDTSEPELQGPTEEFLTSALVSQAIKQLAIAKDRGKPYYLALDFAAPHFPYGVAPGPDEPAPDKNQDDWRTLNDDDHGELIAQIEAAYGGYPGAGAGPTPFISQDLQVSQARAAFKSLVSYVDVQLSRLMEHVDLDNTYVIFVGDNGTQGTVAVPPQFQPLFNAVEPLNDPARSKASLYRNAVEVPFIVAGPGINFKGRTSEALVSTTDIYATVLELMGQKQPSDTRRESISFAKTLFERGSGSPRKLNIAEHYAATGSVGGTAVGPVTAGPDGPVVEGRVIYDGRYRMLAKPVVSDTGEYLCTTPDVYPENDCLDEGKGIYRKETTIELYDIETDPTESEPVTLANMNSRQRGIFSRLCASMNRVSRQAKFFMNDRVCKPDGSNLVDPTL